MRENEIGKANNQRSQQECPSRELEALCLRSGGAAPCIGGRHHFVDQGAGGVPAPPGPRVSLNVILSISQGKSQFVPFGSFLFVATFRKVGLKANHAFTIGKACLRYNHFEASRVVPLAHSKSAFLATGVCHTPVLGGSGSRSNSGAGVQHHF